MEVQTAQRFGREIQADTKEADKPKSVHDICSESAETKLGSQRMDKLFRVRLHENNNERRGHTFAYKTASNHLEAMESTEKTAVGIAEAGNRKRPGETDLVHGRPLPMDSDKDMCSQSNLKRKAVAGRTRQLLRLLFRTSCFEVMLNRRMPNGTYWWCERGELNLPYSIF